jgi:hypothetical protein
MVIVLTGQKRTGKSAAADFFDKKGFKSVALADGFKRDLAYNINRLKFLGKPFSYQDANGETEFDREEKIFSKFISEIIVQETYKRILGSVYATGTIKLYFTKDKRTAYSFRELMQIAGTDIGCNEIDTQIWVKKTLSEIADSKEQNFIISDCRQDHELDVFRKLGFEILHIKRDTSEIVEADTHITEKALKINENDTVINNNSTLDEFYIKLNNFLNKE